MNQKKKHEDMQNEEKLSTIQKSIKDSENLKEGHNDPISNIR